LASNDGDVFRVILDGVHVLVVDDIADNREIERALLEWHGAVVTEAETVREALAVVGRSAVDIVLTDIHMPGEDGYALLRALRERFAAGARRLPVAALTGDAYDRSREALATAGFDAVLFKPVEPDKFIRMVAALLGRF
jgi:CheY-like chemotaxis protein